jgi:hypothetical protein
VLKPSRSYLIASPYFTVRSCVQFRTSVLRVSRLPEQVTHYGPLQRPRWEVVTRPASSPSECSESVPSSVNTFDAVVICNGHYSQPKLAEIKGEIVAVLKKSSKVQ